ncbi:MAG: hypothetical protein LBP53_03155 [Candidatus Peribacteria bacterium]|jgi:hypothetical protein|nr:hypothetical protein [Candidatus Peribacteria bacterium]
MAKNPRFKPFRNTIQKQTTAFTEYVKTITPEGMKAIKNMSWLDNISGFSKLSTEGIHELSRLSYLLRDVDKGADILKALKGATKVDDVKTILAGKGIVVNHIDDAVLMKLAKTKNLTKLQDIINYGAEFKSVQGLKKLITNPTMKYAGKVLGKALVVADFALVGRTFSSNYSEAQKIKLNNETRGERKEDQAYFELTT